MPLNRRATRPESGRKGFVLGLEIAIGSGSAQRNLRLPRKNMGGPRWDVRVLPDGNPHQQMITRRKKSLGKHILIIRIRLRKFFPKNPICIETLLVIPINNTKRSPNEQTVVV